MSCQACPACGCIYDTNLFPEDLCPCCHDAMLGEEEKNEATSA
jgi:hypothetical protein